MTVTVHSEEWRYLRVACALVAVLVAAELVGWFVYRSRPHGASALERTETCLRREKLLSIGPIGQDPIATRARGGALATRVEGNLPSSTSVCARLRRSNLAGDSPRCVESE